MKRSKWTFAFFVAPSLITFFTVVLVPILMGIYYSFTDWNGISNEINFIGLDNYINIIKTDKEFLDSFLFTLKYAVVIVIIVNVIAFLLALLVTQKLKVSNFLRSSFFLPNLIGGVLLGFIWQFIFTKGFQGIADNTGLMFFDGWLSTTITGFWGLIIVSSWQSIGYMMLIYIAALQSISPSVIEAATMDGATGLKKLIYIKLPLVLPAITIGLFLTISGAFKVYDQNMSLTAGGPYNSTQMIAMNIYNTAFVNNNLGNAQAKAVIFLLIIGCITFGQLSLTKKREVEM